MSGEGEHDSAVLSGLPSQFRERADRVFGALPKPPSGRRDQHEVSSNPSSRGSYVGEVKYKGRVHRVCFKSPSRGRHGARYTPDYIRHPGRWTRYDLKEDGTESMSDDQVNKVAASQFLHERKGLSECEATRPIEEKVIFKRPKDKEFVTTSSSSGGSRSSSAGNVHVMPEYEVGKKREHKKEVHSGQTSACHSVKLSHLEEDDS